VYGTDHRQFVAWSGARLVLCTQAGTMSSTACTALTTCTKGWQNYRGQCRARYACWVSKNLFARRNGLCYDPSATPVGNQLGSYAGTSRQDDNTRLVDV